jgi:hypothetical protein
LLTVVENTEANQKLNEGSNLLLTNKKIIQNMVAHAYDPSTQEVEIGRS